MNTETLLGAIVESRKALVESQRAIDAMLLQHANTGNAEFAGEQSAMGRMSMSNGDRSMAMGRQNMLPNDAHFEFLDNNENKNKVGNDLKRPTTHKSCRVFGQNRPSKCESFAIYASFADYEGKMASLNPQNLKSRLGLIIP
jgi:hypothetical protein